MPDIKLTKDTDRFLCVVYKEYLARRKAGKSKVQAGDFGKPQLWEPILFPEWLSPDINSAVIELCKAGLAKGYMGHGFVLTPDAIIYMENRFPHGLEDVLSTLAKFKDAIPFV